MRLTWKQRLSGVVDLPTQPQPNPEPAPSGITYRPWTMDLWQKSTPHLEFMRELMQQPYFRDVLAVLNNSRPRPITSGIDATSAAIALGRREGYDQLMGLLLSLADKPHEPSPEVEPTYGAENFDINKLT